MAVIANTKLFGLCIWIALSFSTLQCREVDQDMEELKTMLRQSLQHNKKLERQIGRFNKVWTGLQQMCDTFDGIPAKTDSTGKKDDKKEDEIDIKAVSSSGLVDSELNVTVTFLASKRFTSRWSVSYSVGETIFVDGIISSDEGLYKNTLRISDVSDDLSGINFKVSNRDGKKSVHINIGRQVLNATTHEDLQLSERPIVNMHETYQAKAGEDMVIDMPVTINGQSVNHTGPGSGEEVLRSTSLHYFFINTTTEPYSFGEAASYGNDDVSITMSGPRGESRDNPDNTMDVTITIKQHIVQFGGILAIYQYWEVPSQLVDYYVIERRAYILIPGKDRPFPQNSVAILQPKTEEYISPNHGTISCTAVGDPSPRLTMLKIRKGGRKPKKMKTTKEKTAYTVSIAKTFVNKSPAAVQGTYICRATNGNITVETTTTVNVLMKVTFDEEHTGLMKNSSEEVIVTCQASGNPRPSLEFVDDYGMYLTGTSKHKVTYVESGKYTSKTSLMMSGEDIEFPTLLCVARQESFPHRLEHRVVINEFIEDNFYNFKNVSYLMYDQITAIP